MNCIAVPKNSQMQDILQKTEKYVREQLQGAEAGHDWWHILRVWNTTKLILETEEADACVCQLAALLHDIADSKFYAGDEEIGTRKAENLLHTLGINGEKVKNVQNIIRNM